MPMYPSISENDYEYIFKDAGIQYAFVGDESILKKVKPLMGKVPSLKGIYVFDTIPGASGFSASLPVLSDDDRADIRSRKEAVMENDLATIIYTSCLLYTSPSPRDGLLSRMPSSA